MALHQHERPTKAEGGIAMARIERHGAAAAAIRRLARLQLEALSFAVGAREL